MSIIAAGTTTTTALSSTGNTDGTLQLQVNGTTPSVTLNTLGAIGVGSTPGYGTSGQVLTSGGSTTAPTWTTNLSSQWTTTGSDIYYNTGNVGVGTSSPSVKLDVTTSTAGYATILTNTNGASDSNGLYVKSGTVSTEYNLRLSNTSGSTDFMVVKGNGNVGIGTTSPTTLVDLARSSLTGSDVSMPLLFVRNTNATQGNGSSTFNQSIVKVDAGNGTVVGGIRAAYDSAGSYGTGMQLYVNSTNPLQFFTNATERFRIGSAGQFGIGGATYGTSGQVLTSGGASAAPTWSTPGAGFSNLVVFTSSTTWTVPAGITKCKVTVTGGGGGGASGNSSTRLGLQGGGAGATATKIVTLSGSSATITIGAGGTAVTGGSNGNSGASSTFVYSATTVTGGGGSGGVLDGTGQNGGTASGGDINIFGGDGFSVSYPNTITAYGGLGGASFWGGGGTGAAGGAYSGRAYGSGGGGNNTNSGSGGAGAGGVITIEY